VPWPAVASTRSRDLSPDERRGGPKRARTALQALERNYRAAFLRYLPSRDEAALHVGYQIGRSAVTDGLSILELAQVHADVFLEVLTDTRPAELQQVATAASDFFLQVLATYDMASRAIPKP